MNLFTELNSLSFELYNCLTIYYLNFVLILIMNELNSISSELYICYVFTI